MKKWLRELDFTDILIISGLILLAVGLAMVSVEVALIVCGVVLMGIGLVGAWRKGENDGLTRSRGDAGKSGG